MMPPCRPIRIVLLLLLSVSAMGGPSQAQSQPNIVILFADDLGYGDIGPFGHPTIDTPHLNRMAREGMTLTQFYAAASVCTPSRAALLTGRLPVRSGLAGDRRVFFPDSKGGLPSEEVTMAEALKETGYATAAIGKWHLGHLPEHLPTEHGFDRYYGVPYSNDMSRHQNDWEGAQGFPPIPLVRNKTIVEQPADQRTLTRRYTEEAQAFIRSNEDRPFFLYLPYTFPHVPLYASEAFQGTSARGLYGDVVEEIDWSVGQVLGTLREQGLADNTLVVFTSDNGPWLIMDERGGTAGLLRGGKGSTWEGGMRVPTIAWWPETIDAGTTSDAVASTMDLFSTALHLAGVPRPADRVIDGDDLMPVFTNPEADGREHIFYYRADELFAVRKGPWKAHFITQSGYAGDRQTHTPPLLYHLEHDPGERFNKAEEHPEVLAEIRSLVDSHRNNLTRRPVQFGNRFEDGARIPLETAPGVPADSSSTQH
jgi:arylsulfatase A-like enzyme